MNLWPLDCEAIFLPPCPKTMFGEVWQSEKGFSNFKAMIVTQHLAQSLVASGIFFTKQESKLRIQLVDKVTPFLWSIFYQRSEDSNWGQLDRKRERYLCALMSPQMKFFLMSPMEDFQEWTAGPETPQTHLFVLGLSTVKVQQKKAIFHLKAAQGSIKSDFLLGQRQLRLWRCQRPSRRTGFWLRPRRTSCRRRCRRRRRRLKSFQVRRKLVKPENNLPL